MKIIRPKQDIIITRVAFILKPENNNL